MARKRAAHQAGIVVEMLQSGSNALLEIIAAMFTHLLQGKGEAPESWKKSLVIILHKKGDTKTLDNYRPITLLPILYKLFTRVLHSRIKGTLEEAQCADQAGFRSGYSCEDHLLSVVLLVEACAEFNVNLW
eukprot:7100371-Karenia_brevis.AAC.1